MANPYQFWNKQMEQHYEKTAAAFMQPYTPPRKTSVNSSISNDSTASRKSSLCSTPGGIQTKSDGCPFSPDLVFERSASVSTRSDDDLIWVPVKVYDCFRRNAIAGCDELPTRPPKLSYIKRLGQRIGRIVLGEPDDLEYRAVKMPRSAYKKYFARDTERNYVGEEPESEWTIEDLEEEFGKYQDRPLRELHC